MKKRLISVLSLLMAISICFSACGKPSGPINWSDVKKLTVNEIPISDFSIVYPADDDYARFAAENLDLYLEQKLGVDLSVSNDYLPAEGSEILIGDTNREVKIKGEDALKENEYALKADGKNIILKAKGYMLGGAVRGFLDICENSKLKGDTLLAVIEEEPIIKKYEYKKAKNALLYIGDGMGFNHIELAKANGMEKFYAEEMPNKGEALTYSASVTYGVAEYTDSAAGATALSSGYKTINGRVGLDEFSEPVKNIRELAAEKGAKTAVLTTDLITGATPSGFLAHVMDRNMTEELQANLDALLKDKKVTIAEGSLDYNLCGRSIQALKTISKNDNFFMMLEEGYIDKNAHNNDEKGVIDTVKRFNETILFAMEFTLVRGDTVLIITADHETGGLDKDGSKFKFTSPNHTNRNVPLYAMGKGTKSLVEKPLNNVMIPKFIAKIYGEKKFGDPAIKE